MINTIWAIARRDLRFAFSTPLAWLVLACWAIIINTVFVFFTLSPVREIGAVSTPLFMSSLRWGGLLLTLLAPAITMGSFTHERERHTMPLLLTLPVSDSALVIGKWLAAWILLVALLIVSGGIPLTLYLVSDPGGWQLFSGYAGLLVQSALLAALGIWISSLVDAPLAAYIITFAAIALLQIFGFLAQQEGTIAGSIGHFLGMGHRLEQFIQGDVRLGDVAYFPLLSVVCVSQLFNAFGGCAMPDSTLKKNNLLQYSRHRS